ncbi:MAG: glycosyltransferase [Acidobacteria bacterium]|nr:glycosyltransferase [Acidobacteriota bacterium]
MSALDWPVHFMVPNVEASRRAILRELHASEPFTLVRAPGNLGDQLIAAGARRLFASLPYRELSIAEALRSGGGLAVLMGGGAWSNPYHEVMPSALRALAARYERVIVLPSSFDVSVDVVRDALLETRAIVFAREEDSFRALGGICNERRLAHDTAFFFDFSPYAIEGRGVLHAFRGDAEASGRAPIATDNRDISVELQSLDEWLWTIARHADVHTDRAHVMIAAAMLGKRVVAYPSATAKIPAIAKYALADVRVVDLPPVITPVAPATAPQNLRERLTALGEESLRRLPALPNGAPRVTVIVLSYNRIDQTKACIASLAAHVRIPFKLRVIDNGSAAPVREELARVCAQYPFAELQQLEANLRCVGARQLGAESSDTEYVAFVDDDAEVFPGTIEQLVHALDRDPELRGVGARIVLPNGKLQFCGGAYEVRDGVIRFVARHRDAPFDALLAPETSAWLGGTAFACRRDLFADFPLDLGMSTYFEDNEWSYRITRALPHAFRTAPDALVLHHQETKERRGSDAAEIGRAVDFLVPIARFYERHGLVMEDFFGFVPELQLPDGGRDVGAARILLELMTLKGGDWVAAQWTDGGLESLFLRREFLQMRSSRWYQLADRYWRLRNKLWRLV